MKEQGGGRQKWIRTLLQCPECRSPQLLYDQKEIHCEDCFRTYRIIGDRCVFHDDLSISHVDYNRRSFRVSPRFIEIIKRNGGLALNMGCGSQPDNIDGIVDFDYILCPNTDVVGDGHALPFRDSLFQTVLSLNVFEHLRNPHQAVEEIQRVSRRGGLLIIHTAFMQPQHDFAHFFNATRSGIREWFTPYFSESYCIVSPNFTVEKTVAWTAHDFLRMVRKYCPEKTVTRYENMTLRELEMVWKDLYSDTSEELYKLIKDIPDEAQGELSLGFEFVGVKK
ncbi:MAG: class I SAM-dependent methyltransferase [Rectinemataceae bacterium]|nr:class I SAM-dependent methyltransferase [Rectinemataceae bacterium]